MATPSVYQRVGNAAVTPSDYDSSVGKVYLRFNGTNQWLQTNSINFTNTAQMFVCAGVRKLSDSAVGMISELGVNTGTNAGSFLMASPGSPSPSYYALALNGSGYFERKSTNTGFTSPVTNVISVNFNIANTGNDEITFRANGTTAALSTVAGSDAGTGNYGNYPLYIGARAGSNYWFNGRLYSLIVAGKLANAVEITETEKYVNGKTAAY